MALNGLVPQLHYLIERVDRCQIFVIGIERGIGDFQSAITGLTAATFTTEQPSGKEELRLTVTLDNENVSTVEIAIYRYDGSFCLVTVDGTPTALVSRSAAMDLMEAVNAIVLN